MYSPPDPTSFNQLCWEIVRQIPPGRVSTYAQVASIIPPPSGVDELQYQRLSPRWVGGAMHAVPDGSDVPWHRVINSKGEISVRSSTEGHVIQRHLLKAEGVQFDADGRVDFAAFGWSGPDPDWLVERGLRQPKSLTGQTLDEEGGWSQPRLL